MDASCSDKLRSLSGRQCSRILLVPRAVCCYIYWQVQSDWVWPPSLPPPIRCIAGGCPPFVQTRRTDERIVLCGPCSFTTTYSVILTVSCPVQQRGSIPYPLTLQPSSVCKTRRFPSLLVVAICVCSYVTTHVPHHQNESTRIVSLLNVWPVPFHSYAYDSSYRLQVRIPFHYCCSLLSTRQLTVGAYSA